MTAVSTAVEVRALVVAALAKALAEAWRRQQLEQQPRPAA
jgi:hypothetical protein